MLKSLKIKESALRKKFFSGLLAGLILFPIFRGVLAAQGASPVSVASTPSANLTPQPVLNDGGIRTPFSNEEEKFYRKAWPIRKSHSAQALLVIGGVFLVILTLLLRKMFQSPPRRPRD